jgi:hypothetical protein
MPPSSIIDVSYQKRFGVYWALEKDGLWRTDNISASGAATWTQVLDAATYSGDLPGLKFARVVGAPSVRGRVYVLAVSDDGTRSAYMFRSATNGLTWSYSLIDDTGTVGEPPEITVSTVTWELDRPSGGAWGYSTHTRLGDEDNPTYNPWAIAWTYTRTGNGEVGYEYRDTQPIDPPETAYINQFSTSAIPPPDRPQVHRENSLTLGELTTLTDFMTEFFGGAEGAGWDYDVGNPPGRPFDTDAERVRVGHGSNNSGGTPSTMFITDWVFWHYPDDDLPTAMDVAVTNSDWLYVGFDEAIYKSTDGGFTWTQVTASYGAWDLKIHPLLAGVFIFWTPDGELFQCIADTVQSTAMLTGATPTKKAHRIAYDPANGGKIWVLAHTDSSTADLKRWYLGSFADQETGISGAAGVNAFTKGGGLNYVMYLSGDDIWLSEDDGASFEAKIGDWAGYSGPILGHML